jgi:hypothetical protein
VSPRRRADGRRARAIALASVLLGAACVTTYEDAPLLGAHSTDDGRVEPAPAEYLTSLSIPFGDGATDPTQPVVAEFYGGVLQRMHEAAVERDPATLEALVASYTRPDLPEHMQQRVKGYGEVARGLRFREHARAQSKLVLMPLPSNGSEPAPVEAGYPALGAPVQLELQLPASATPLVLGGRDDDHPIAFSISIVVEDTTAEGGSGSSSHNRTVWLPEEFALRGRAVLRLPILVDLPGGNAVKRHVTVRVDLMPGYVQHEQGRAPVPRTTLAATALTQWPVGYGNVAKAPLAELRRPATTARPRSSF